MNSCEFFVWGIISPESDGILIFGCSREVNPEILPFSSESLFALLLFPFLKIQSGKTSIRKVAVIPISKDK